ncbi:type II toxin-antitoxin system VapC family toxin [soil metagenome]
MIIDTSAIVAILRAEHDASRYIDALATAEYVAMSAATYVETSVVVDANRDPVLSRRFDELVATAAVQIEPLTAEHATIARRAYQDFGKGSGHAAQLNLGDCFSYALAAARQEPLLYKGEDFRHTGLASAI